MRPPDALRMGRALSDGSLNREENSRHCAETERKGEKHAAPFCFRQREGDRDDEQEAEADMQQHGRGGGPPHRSMRRTEQVEGGQSQKSQTDGHKT